MGGVLDLQYNHSQRKGAGKIVCSSELRKEDDQPEGGPGTNRLNTEGGR